MDTTRTSSDSSLRHITYLTPRDAASVAESYGPRTGADASAMRPRYAFVPDSAGALALHPPQPPRRLRMPGVGDFVLVDTVFKGQAQRDLVEVVDRQEVRDVVGELRARRLQQLQEAESASRADNVDMYMGHGSGVLIGNWSTQLGMAMGLGMAARGLYDGAWLSALCGAGVAALFRGLHAAQQTQDARYKKAEIAFFHKGHMEFCKQQTELRRPLDEAGPWAGL